MSSDAKTKKKMKTKSASYDPINHPTNRADATLIDIQRRLRSEIKASSDKFASKKTAKVRQNVFSLTEDFDIETELEFIDYLIENCLFEDGKAW